jgi:hypothetical protein
MKDASLIAIYGRRGTGKTTLARSLVAKKRRLVVYDPTEEYSRDRGIIRADGIDKVRDIMTQKWKQGFRIAYVPPAGKEVAGLHHLCNLLMAAQRAYYDGQGGQQITLLVEEMNLSYPVTALPAQYPGMPNVASRGRHYGIEVIGVTQRPAEVSTRFRENCAEVFCLALAGDISRKTVAKDIGNAALAERLAGLRPYEYLRWNQASGTLSTGKTPK